MKQCNNSCADRFWSKVFITDKDSCWPWLGNIGWHGYGIFKCGGKNQRTNRVAFFLFNGYWPNVCRHTCDNPSCCNPNHLLDGTHAENAADKVARGRCNPARGNEKSNAKLTPEKVTEIRILLSQGMSQRSIAPLFGVSATVIGRIANGTMWSHV